MEREKLLKELISEAKSSVHDELLSEDAMLDDHADLIIGERTHKPKEKGEDED